MKSNLLRKTVITGISSLLFTGVLSLGLCVGWFYRKNAVDIDALTGSVLKRYFEDGDGSVDHPFEIARPKQYENFVRLHYEMPEFASRGFNFVLGHNFAAEGNAPDYHFYTYSDDGIFSPAQTDVLNMTSICDASKNKPALPPLGTEELPFAAKLEGNNLTVANFRIGGDGYKDIGIFGFVDQNAKVTNTYFKDFEIDTTACAYADNTTESTHLNHGDSSVYMGYLAGHIHDTSSFNDVYVNNCKLTGTKQLSRTVDEYGYYGHADIDSLGGQNTGKGGDYQFTLDSEACFNYFNDNYNTISDQQLVLRNTQETGWGNEERQGDSATPTPFSAAVSKGSAIGNYGTTYVLSGRNPNQPNAAMTNSLSTIGYVSGPRTTTSVTKDVYYKRSNSSAYNVPADDTIMTDLPSDNNPDPGNYFYFDGSAWKYYHSDNRAIETDDTFDLTISFTQYDKYYATLFGSTAKNISINGTLFFDNQQINIPCNATNRTSLVRNIRISSNNVVLRNLPLGTHYIALVFTLNWTYDENNESHSYVLGGTVSAGSTNLGVYNPEYVLRSGGGITASLNYNFNAFSGDGYATRPSNPAGRNHDPAPQNTVLVCETTYNADVYFKNENQYYPLANDDENDYSTASFNKSGSVWTTTFTKVILDDSDPSQITNHFTGDEPELIASGYDSRVIDIVGGNTRFWYYNRSFLFGLIKINIKIVSLPSETSTNYVTKAITEEDLGKPFYATQYCPDSVIAYIKNVSNAAAHRNDYLGRIDFQYVSTDQIELATPVFKKGNGVFNNLANSGVEPEDPMEPDNDLNRVISRELYEDNVQACSYVALDRNKNIIGTFNADGSYGVGMTEERLKDIYYYVLAVGGSGNNDTWMTKVKFEYQAEYGYGGTFGNVGYRSADDPKITDGTILNFAFVMQAAASNRYEIIVYFEKEDDETTDLLGTYHIEVYTDLPITDGLNVFNYFPEFYNVFVKTSRNGTETQMDGMSQNFALPGSTY